MSTIQSRQMSESEIDAQQRESLAQHGIALVVTQTDNDIWGDDTYPVAGYTSYNFSVVVTANEEAMVTANDIGIADIVPPGTMKLYGDSFGSQYLNGDDALPAECVITIETQSGTKKFTCLDFVRQCRNSNHEFRNSADTVLQLTPVA